ncbi:hypothetical protein RCL1_005901 [Eukaryota sp. TZLM3-RCL]
MNQTELLSRVETKKSLYLEYLSSVHWKKFKEKKDARLYTMETNQGLYRVKTDVVVDAPADEVFRFMRNPANRKIIERTAKLEKTYYDFHEHSLSVMHYKYALKVPFVADREAVVCEYSRSLGSDRFLIGAFSVDDLIPNLALTDTTNVMADVNMTAMGLFAVDKVKTKIVTISEVDPKGSIPKALVNFVAEHRISSALQLKDTLEKYITLEKAKQDM